MSDWEVVRGQLEHQVSVLRGLQGIENDLLRVLEQARQARARMDGEVADLVRQAEGAGYSAMEYRKLFDGISGDLSAACSRNSLSGRVRRETERRRRFS